MSTAEPTAKCSCGSKRPLGYVPGASIFQSKRPRRARQARRAAGPFPGCPRELVELIVQRLQRDGAVAAILRLSMVARGFRDEILDNLKLWQDVHRRYVRIGMFRNMLPNFIYRRPPFWFESSALAAEPARRQQVLRVLRKMAVLRYAHWCGLCGSTRFSTDPVWSLGMRVCKFCFQDNLVSDHVLYHRYWFNVPQLMELDFRRVFFFTTAVTRLQRLEYTTDPVDFAGGTGRFLFFWRPHLARILDLPALQAAALDKERAAASIRALARRACVLRRIEHTRGKTSADKRHILFRLVASGLRDEPGRAGRIPEIPPKARHLLGWSDSLP